MDSLSLKEIGELTDRELLKNGFLIEAGIEQIHSEFEKNQRAISIERLGK